MASDILTAKIEDLFRLCDKYQSPKFSKFLNEAEQELVKKNIGNPVGYNSGFFGGYSDSQRKLFGVFPEWMEFDEKHFPIRVLEITKKYSKELSHRDYLGTVLSLGIDRTNVGDIFTKDGNGFIYLLADISEYVADNIEKIANVGVNVKIKDFTNITPPEPKFEIINTVCASHRLDAVVAAMLNVSRNNSASLIRAEKVSVNHLPITATDYMLSPGNVISVRGFGRFIFEAAGSKTRSDRIHITVKKYI